MDDILSQLRSMLTSLLGFFLELCAASEYPLSYSCIQMYFFSYDSLNPVCNVLYQHCPHPALLVLLSNSNKLLSLLTPLT